MDKFKIIIDFHNPSSSNDPKTVFHNDRLQLDLEINNLVKSIQTVLDILESSHLPIISDNPNFWSKVFKPLSEYCILKTHGLFGSNDELTMNTFKNFVFKNKNKIFDEKWDPEFKLLNEIFLEYREKVAKKYSNINVDVNGIRNNYIAHNNKHIKEYSVTIFQLMEVVYSAQYTLRKLQHYSDNGEVDKMSPILLHSYQNQESLLKEINKRYTPKN